jgi:hypothetical protein
VLLLFFSFKLLYFGNSTHLKLEHVFYNCTFHLVHDNHDLEFTDSVIQSNQGKNQIWTVYNTSRPLVKSTNKTPSIIIPGKLFDVTLNLRESRACNIHLITQQNFTTRFGIEQYSKLQFIRPQNERSIFILVTKFHVQFDMQWENGALDFRLFNFVVQNGGLHEVRSYCSPIRKFQSVESIGVNTSLNLFLVKNQCSNYNKVQVQAAHGVFITNNARMNCLSPTKLAGHAHLEYGTCLREVKLTALVIQRMNGTDIHADHNQDLSMAACIHEFGIYLGMPSQNVIFHRRERGLLIYCEYDKSRIRNEVNWVGALDLSSWLLVIGVCTLGATVHAVRRIGPSFVIRFDLFAYFNLLQREASAANVFQLGIIILSSMFFTYYENFLTSVTLAPNPPMVYASIKEALDSGYKILYPLEVGPELIYKQYKRMFEKLGIPHLLNTSFSGMDYMDYAGLKILNRNQAKLIASAYSVPMLRVVQYRQKVALCHIIKQPLDEDLVFAYLNGLLAETVIGNINKVIESGIYDWWERLDLFFYDLQNENQRRQIGYVEVSPEAPHPIAMDFEVMRIFPFSGCLLGLAALVFMCEVISEFIRLTVRTFNEIFYV